MTEINRRRFVASLTAATAFTGLAPSLARSEIAAPTNEQRLIHSDKITFMDDSDKNKLNEWWCIIRRCNPHAISTAAERPAVDFWSREYSDINYADHLPPEIPRRTLFYESCDRKDFNIGRAFAVGAFRSHRRTRRLRMVDGGGPQDEKSMGRHQGGLKTE